MNRFVLICTVEIDDSLIEVAYPLLTKYSKKQVQSELQFYKSHVLDKISKNKKSEIMIFILGNITFSIGPFIKDNLPKVLTVSEWFKEKSDG